jgi:glycosyltransferase involved in cell wall biosynthesis
VSKNTILIFIDKFQAKLLPQVEVIRSLGLEPIFFETIKSNSSADVQITQLAQGFFARIKQVSKVLKANNIHHIEVYPGGRFSFIYLILSKLYKVKSICIERGDLIYYHSAGYDLFTRASMFITYRLANIVWYKEPFMQAILAKIGVARIKFIHNISRKPVHKVVPRDIDFLWVNRVLAERYSDWMIAALSKEKFSHTKNYLLGMPDQDNSQSNIIKNAHLNNLEVLPIVPPESYYQRSKFFLLFSKAIFANHSLLEAMSYGVIPIINESNGSELIVQNNYNGFIVATEQEAIAKMEELLLLPESERIRISQNCIDTIEQKFSLSYFRNEIEQLYQQL